MDSALKPLAVSISSALKFLADSMRIQALAGTSWHEAQSMLTGL